MGVIAEMRGFHTMARWVEPNEWVASALCAADPPDALFVQGAAQRQARLRCIGCPVRLECLAEALQWHSDFGVWGGLTERERRALRRSYPHVEDWLTWLLTSSDELAEAIRVEQPPQVLARVRRQSRAVPA